MAKLLGIRGIGQHEIYSAGFHLMELFPEVSEKEPHILIGELLLQARRGSPAINLVAVPNLPLRL